MKAKKTITQQERGQMLLREPINKVIPRLAVPTIISMLITSVYNMADTFFVGRIGTSASGAVGVVFSAMAFIQAIAFTIGIGSSANMSREMGAGNMDEARKYVAQAFFFALGTGVVVAALGLILIDPLVRVLGATETIAPYAKAYATYIFYGAPFLMTSLVLNNLLRFQGLALYAMVGTGIGGLLNMALDPLFIFTLGMGTAGAGAATAVSQLVSFVILVVINNRRTDTLHVRVKDFQPTRRRVWKMLYNGFPSLGRQGIASVATIILNNVAGQWGDPAIAAMSIVSRYTMFINSAVVGFGQGFQPVCAYCFGARAYGRVRKAYFFCVKISTFILFGLAGISMLFSGSIVQVFRDDPEVIAIGTTALRLQLLTVPFWGFYTMSNMFTQSIGFGGQATVLAAARQGIFLIPMLLILPPLFGLTGLQLSPPVGDLLSVILSWLIVRGTLAKMKQMGEEK